MTITVGTLTIPTTGTDPKVAEIGTTEDAIEGLVQGVVDQLGNLSELDSVDSSILSDNSVTNAKLANMDTDLLKGRATSGTGDPEDLTATQVRTILNVEDGATADLTGSEIKTLYEAQSDTNALTDTLLTKLNGIETDATADLTGSEIKTLYENESDTNALTDTLLTKLNGIETDATADLTGSEIKTLYEAQSDTNALTDTLLTKLNAVSETADVDSVAGKTGVVTLDIDDVDGLSDELGTDDSLGDLFSRAVSVHGAPTDVDLFRKSANTVILDDSQNDLLNNVGTDGDGFGSLIERTPVFHGAPTKKPLTRTAGNTVLLQTEEAPTQIANVKSGEGWIYNSDGSIRISDGFSSSGPEVLAVDIDDHLTISRTRPYTGYSSVPDYLSLPLDVDMPFTNDTDEVWFIIYHGQSQATASTGEIITTGTPNATRLAMFNGGMRTQHTDGTVDRKHWIIGEDIFSGGLVPMQEGTGYSTTNETPLTSLCSAILPGVPSNVALVGATFAAGGREVTELGVGNGCWHNIAVTIAYLRQICERRNLRFKVAGFFWSQGGANQLSTVTEYTDLFIDNIYTPFNNLMVDQGYTSHEVPFFINGMTHATANTTMDVARAALAMADDTSKNITAVGAEYIYPSAYDEGFPEETAYTVHIGAPGVNMRSQFEAEAFLENLGGGNFEPLRMTSGTLSGSTATVSTNASNARFTTPLVLNNSSVATVTNGGFVFLDDGDGNSVTIDSFSTNASHQFIFVLSDVPTGSNPKIGYALGDTAETMSYQGPTHGARGQVCDSDTSTITLKGTARSLAHCLHTDIIDLT